MIDSSFQVAYRLTARQALPRSFSYGVGWNWFEQLGSGGYYARWHGYPLDVEVHPDPDDHEAWSELCKGLDELSPGFIRFGLPPDPHVGADGAFQSGTVHLRRLSRLDEWARKRDCTILLDTFSMPQRFEFPLPPGEPGDGSILINMAAADNAAYARKFVAPLLKYVVDAGMESVRFFNPINEPMEYGVYQTPEEGPDMYAHYVEMYREMRAALDEEGISRSRMGLVGIDSSAITYPLLEFYARSLDIDPFVEAYSRHFYNLRFDGLPPADGSWTSPIADAIDRQTSPLIRFANHRGKPLLVTEIGTFHYGWRSNNPAGAASIDATLTVAESVIRGINIGAECFAFWCLMNPNTIDGRWSAIEFQGSRLVRCGFPFAIYGMLARAARPGSIVHPLSVSPGSVLNPIHGTLLERPDGTWAILVVNDSPTQNFGIEVHLPEHASTSEWSVEVTDRARLNEPLASVSTQPGWKIELCVPSFSLVSLQSQPVGNPECL